MSFKNFTDEDFPVTAIGTGIYFRNNTVPICHCHDMLMANEIAMRLNRDNQQWPEVDARDRAVWPKHVKLIE